LNFACSRLLRLRSLPQLSSRQPQHNHYWYVPGIIRKK
jgi:hypothetical protein